MSYNAERLGTGEKVVYTAHMHWIVLVRSAIQWIALFVLAAVMGGLAVSQAGWDVNLKNILGIVSLVAMIVSFVAFIISYFIWRSEQYIITNERVIYIEGIINKRESATALDKINDIETYQSIWGRMLGYGTVTLLTGSESGATTLKFLDKANEFKKIMLDAKNRHYGDASDHAPGGIAHQRERDGYYAPQERQYVQNGPAYQPQAPLPPMPRQQQPNPTYQSDPRGFAPPPQYQPAGGGGQQQILDAIEKLARLRDSGAITEAEFQSKKNELMGRL